MKSEALDNTLENSELYYSLFKETDALDVFEAITPQLTKYLSWHPPKDYEEFQEVAKRWSNQCPNGPDLTFVIRIKGVNCFVGIISIRGLNKIRPEIGLWIRESYQSKGFGKSSVLTVVNWAHANFGIKQFLYPVVKENIISIRLIQSIGGKLQKIGNHKKDKDTTNTILYYHLSIRALKRLKLAAVEKYKIKH